MNEKIMTKRKISLGALMIAVLIFSVSSLLFSGTYAPVHGKTSEVIVSGEWYACESYKNCATFGIDMKQKYGDSAYSFKIVNTGYNYATIRKDVILKPNTQYRYSAMVKYIGYELEPGSNGDAGASIGVLVGDNWRVSSYSNSSEWVKVSYSFWTDGTGKAAIYLRNGYPYCKGTAYYSDIRLEEAVCSTDQWNILVLIVKNIDADLNIEGKITNYKGSYTDEDVSFIKNNLPDQLKKQLPRVSDGLIGVNDVDVYSFDNAVKEANTEHNYLSLTDKTLRNELDKYVNKKTYQQIILVTPFEYGTTSWLGLAGFDYEGIKLCQYIHYSGTNSFDDRSSYSDYPISGYIHEILHGVEADSKQIDGSKTPDFHENIGIYSDYYSDAIDGWFSYHHDYISGNLPDGRGINKSVLKRPSLYVLVSDDMTIGKGIAVSGTVPKHISSVLSIGNIKSVTYKGKAVKPSVKVTGGTLGKNYTVSYSDNKEAGTGKVIISGTGEYYGSLEKTFEIKLKKPSVKVKNGKFKWSQIPGADGYEIYISKDGKKYEKLDDVSKLSYSKSKLSEGTYSFKIRAYARTNSGLIYSKYSKVKKLK